MSALEEELDKRADEAEGAGLQSGFGSSEAQAGVDFPASSQPYPQPVLSMVSKTSSSPFGHNGNFSTPLSHPLRKLGLRESITASPPPPPPRGTLLFVPPILPLFVAAQPNEYFFFKVDGKSPSSKKKYVCCIVDKKASFTFAAFK